MKSRDAANEVNERRVRGKLEANRLFSRNLAIETSDNAVRYKMKKAIAYLEHLKMLESDDLMTMRRLHG